MSLPRRNVLDIKKKSSRPAPAVREAAPQQPAQQRRLVRLRTKRRRQRLMTAGIGILATFTFVGLVGGLTHLNRLAINDVLIVGAERISSQELTQSVQEGFHNDGFQLFSKSNIFLYPRTDIESTLAETFPRVKTVSISRESLFAQSVIVSLEERRPYARWCFHEATECNYVMDENGYIFADEVSAKPTTEYQFREGLIPNTDPIGQTLLRGRFDGMMDLLRTLKKEGFPSHGIEIITESDFAVFLKDGPTLYIPFEMSIEDVVRNLNTALEAESLRERLAELEYIDLRFGNRIYYK